MIAELVRKNRSIRRFRQDRALTVNTLRSLVDLARLSASAANLQPLRYIISCDPQINERVFSCLGWAAYLKDWRGPVEGERPAGYIIVLGDTENANDYIGYDCGIASQSILLGAAEKGIGGCMIASINRKKLRKILNVRDPLDLLLVIALGEPGEQVVIEAVKHDKNIRYWRDESGVHHVPKRDLDDIIVGTYFKSEG